MIRPRSLPLSLLLTALLAALFASGGCATRTAEQPDLIRLNQDAGAYHGLPGDFRLLPEVVQDGLWADFLTRHFDPWVRTAPKHPAEEAFWGLTTYKGRKLYGENTLLRDPAWLESMKTASDAEHFPSLHRPAIAVTNASMRVLPTEHPAFYDFALAGEGFPFDYMQNSLVLAGTPLLATHVSRDRAWVLVESRFTFGWVRATDIAWVDDGFMAAFRTGTYVALTRDNVPVTDLDGQFLLSADIGCILPTERTESGPVVLVPVRDHRGDAVLHRAALDPEDAQPAPIPATPDNFARIAGRMLGQQYGWGGLYGNRDCSATTMDLMAGFGLFLPRNSSQQAKVGTVVELEGLDREARIERIREKGTPFLTLVRKPGHIMLYIGQLDGQPVVLHTIWGLKTVVGDGFGRAVIGRTVITTLTPGEELDNLARPDGVLLMTVQRLSTLP